MTDPVRRRVVVTGMGVLAPNGIGLDAFSSAIFSGKSGLGPITRFEATNFKTKVVGEIKDFDAINYMPISVARKTDRFAQLGLAAAKMAIEDARLNDQNQILGPANVIIGSGLGGSNFHEETMLAFIESRNPKSVAASAVPRITPNAVSAYIALQYGIKGLNLVISTACSSSANAIGIAFKQIRNSEADLVLTGGVEATITPVNIAMYESMMVLGSSVTGRTEDASRPFDATRNGFVMSEGAACLILESLDNALKRNVPIYAEILGFGSACGAYHMVSPNPSGEDAKEVMETALKDAMLSKDDIDSISAHGTSTKLNDLSETRAIKSLFGNCAYKIPVSGIKSMIGHSIGASGAIQAVVTCLSLQKGLLAPTINLNNPDPECDLDYVVNRSRKMEIRNAISNSFGFGSNNAVLIIGRR